MPNLGDIIKGSDLGYKLGSSSRSRYIWHACVGCGKERWVIQHKAKRQHPPLCKSCAAKKRDTWQGLKGPNNPRWKGGRRRTQGYMQVYLPPDDFFFPMANNNYVLEHRLVMAKHLHRCLLPWEVVHHRNGIKDDNRLENLQLLPNPQQHLVDTLLQKRVTILEKRVTLLEAENVALRQQLAAILEVPYGYG